MNFKEMTLLQLKAYAKEKGIRGVSTLKKNQLIERIIASENKSIQTNESIVNIWNIITIASSLVIQYNSLIFFQFNHFYFWYAGDGYF